MKRLLLFVPLLLFGGEINVPKPYMGLLKQILPPKVDISIDFYGDTIKGVIKEYSKGGYTRIDIAGDDFISFYSQLYTTLTGQKPPSVAISVEVGGQKLPYNPFFQLWDRDNGVRLLKFSRLKPGCKPPVVKIEATGIGGAKVWTTFGEIKKKLFEGGFKNPTYYCY